MNDSNCKSHSYCHLLGGHTDTTDTLEFCTECNNETLIIENIKLAIKQMYFVVRHEDGSTTLSDDPGEGDQERVELTY